MAAKMSSQSYKALGIKAFRENDFHNAKLFFVLAYEKRKNQKLLVFISLCTLALTSYEEAILLFEFYLKHYKHASIVKDMEKLLNVSESRLNLAKNLKDDENKALSYKDFLESEKELGFKQSFENVIFANKLIISDKNDFLDFLEKLLDNGYEEMMLNYLENTSTIFSGNQKFERLKVRLLESKK